MELSRKVRRGCALALAAVLTLPGLSLMKTQAAVGIETGRDDCSLTVSVGVGGSDSEYLEDFNRMTIPVSVYRVADVDVTGQNYTPVGAFASMKLDGITSDHSAMAAVWQELAGEAAGIVEQASPPLTAAGSTLVENTSGTGSAEGTVGDLAPGLYLVVPDAAYNPEYTVRYTFAPYLTALPSSEYALTGSGSDEWDYDTTIGLKPEAEPQFGRLHITKILQNYNETLGPTTFVFHVVGVDQDQVVRYEEVESMTYTAAGSNTITLEHIPAGLTVTVTEVYSGASYEIVGAAEDTALIWSDAAVLDRVENASEASVTFENRYDGGNRGGYGVTNHFESDGAGGWTWENPTTPPEE